MIGAIETRRRDPAPWAQFGLVAAIQLIGVAYLIGGLSSGVEGFGTALADITDRLGRVEARLMED